MADKITLGSVGNIDNSLLSTINNNNALITTAFDNTLSRDGTTPNQMFASLDMNGFQVLNLPAPATVNSPARLIDVVTPGSITITTATTGTSGHSVPFLDGTNTWSAPQTLTLTTGAGATALAINQTASGNTSNTSLNTISITDTTTSNPGFSNGLFINQQLGANITGGRQGLLSQVTLNAASGVGSTNRNYIGIVGYGIAGSADNGTGVTSATGQGSFFGIQGIATTAASATNLLAVSGAAFNLITAAGSTMWAKSLAQFSPGQTDGAVGSGINTMLWCFNEAGGTPKWTNAILIDHQGGVGSWPIATTGTIIKTNGNGTVANGIDFTNTTFTASSFSSPGFAVNPTGGISSGAAGGTSGTIAFAGSTSGSVSLGSNSTGTLLTCNQPIQTGVIGSVAGSVTIAGLTSGSAVLSCSATAGTLQLGAGNALIDSGGNITTNGFVQTFKGTAPPAGGGAVVFFTTLANLGIYVGTGNPTASAAKGSIYLETGAGQLWLNTSGSTTWTQVTVP